MSNIISSAAVPLSALPSIEVPTGNQGQGPPTSIIAPSSSPIPSPYPPYKHLLEAYLHLPPLPDEKSPIDRKSYINPPFSSPSLSSSLSESQKQQQQQHNLSKYYSAFPSPFHTGSTPSEYIPNVERPVAAWDAHIYFSMPSGEGEDGTEALYARHLWERIRREFPELRIYRIWPQAIGPHPLPMFEVNIFTPAQFGAFVPWLAVHRGPLSILVHPNTKRGEVWDHTAGAMWLGEKKELVLGFLQK